MNCYCLCGSSRLTDNTYLQTALKAYTHTSFSFFSPLFLYISQTFDFPPQASKRDLEWWRGQGLICESIRKLHYPTRLRLLLLQGQRDASALVFMRTAVCFQVYVCQCADRRDWTRGGKHNLMFEDKAGTEVEDKQGKTDGKKKKVIIKFLKIIFFFCQGKFVGSFWKAHTANFWIKEEVGRFSGSDSDSVCFLVWEIERSAI